MRKVALHEEVYLVHVIYSQTSGKPVVQTGLLHPHVLGYFCKEVPSLAHFSMTSEFPEADA